jgi:hypothetical protein
MSYKSKLFPLSSTCETPLLRLIGHSWGSSTANLEDVKLLRSRFVDDCKIRTGLAPGRANWDKILGLAAAIVISASFWAGVWLTIARVWK